MSVYEVNGSPTSPGSVTITVTAPVGYSLSFYSSLTSIAVSGASPAENPILVTNANRTVINTVGTSQISLKLKADQSIAAKATMQVGFSLTRTNANSGSVSNYFLSVHHNL